MQFDTILKSVIYYLNPYNDEFREILAIFCAHFVHLGQLIMIYIGLCVITPSVISIENHLSWKWENINTSDFT